MAKLVLGAGASSVSAIRSSDSDPENWELARVVFPREFQEAQYMKPERWCVLVDDDVVESDLNADRATICYLDVLDLELAIETIRLDRTTSIEDLVKIGAI